MEGGGVLVAMWLIDTLFDCGDLRACQYWPVVVLTGYAACVHVRTLLCVGPTICMYVCMYVHS